MNFQDRFWWSLLMISGREWFPALNKSLVMFTRETLSTWRICQAYLKLLFCLPDSRHCVWWPQGQNTPQRRQMSGACGHQGCIMYPCSEACRLCSSGPFRKSMGGVVIHNPALEDEDIRCRKVNGREVASSQVFLPKGCWFYHSTATRNGVSYIIFFLQQCPRSNDTPIYPDFQLSFLTPGIKVGFAVPAGEVPTATAVGVYGDRKSRRTWLCGVWLVELWSWGGKPDFCWSKILF